MLNGKALPNYSKYRIMILRCSESDIFSMKHTLEKLSIKRGLERIKSGLKQQGLSYEDVAASLGVSEITVKRMLNNDDISLTRFYHLAEMAGLQVSELLSSSKEEPQKHTYFTKAQDEAFAREPHLSYFFFELFYFEKSVEEITNKYSLSEVSVYRYLRKLDELELIKLDVGNKFRFLVKPPMGFAADSLVLRQDVMSSIEETAKRVICAEPDPNSFLLSKPLKIHEDMYEQMLLDIRSILDKYAEVSENFFSSLPDDAGYKVMIVGHPYEINDESEYDIINLDTE